MRSLELDCPRFGRLRCLGAALNTGHDFLVRSNCTRADLELLIFLDSRGVSSRYPGSLIERILLHVESRQRYIAVCRPLELTMWATLFNFLELNDLSPRRVVTNVGFVDFTPKKQSILVDAEQQVAARMGPGLAQSHFVEDYASSAGEAIPLFAMSYAEGYQCNIEAALRGSSTVVINTPLVSPDIPVQRKRPGAFFKGLAATKEFNRSLESATVIDLPQFDHTRTYDGVHYTDRGNELIFERLLPHL